MLFLSMCLGAVLAVVVVLGALPQDSVPSNGTVLEYRGVLFVGVSTSARLSLVAIVGGTLLGTLLAVLRLIRNPSWLRFVTWPATTLFTYTFLSMPAYTLILFAYYWDALKSWQAFWVAAAALAINLSPFAAQIITAGLENTPQAQIESAKAFGYRGWQLYSRFYLSSIWRSVGRPLLVQYYTTIKLSSLASVIGVRELMHSGQTVIRATYETMPVYALVAVGYFLLVTPVALFSDYLERRHGTQ